MIDIRLETVTQEIVVTPGRAPTVVENVVQEIVIEHRGPPGVAGGGLAITTAGATAGDVLVFQEGLGIFAPDQIDGGNF